MPTREPVESEMATPDGGGPLEAAPVTDAAAERVAQLVAEGILGRYPRCPVCGSPRRVPAAHSGSDNRYLRAIPRIAPIPLSEVLALLRAHRCEDCSAAYCDPWLSRRVAARLYTSGFGQHYGGWEIFHASLAGSEVATHAWWQAHTWERLCAVAGPIVRYAELNCPFSGLLTFFRRRELSLPEYRRRFRAAARGLRSRRPHPGGVPAAVRQLLAPRAPATGASPLRSMSADFPAERTLVVEQSSSCWGGGCISQGLSCQSLAPVLLAADGLTFGDVDSEGLRFDAAVLTQLDHFFDPMRVLERFLDLAGVVVVAGHHSNRFTRQHHFAFGPRTADFLADRGCHVVDVTSETVHPSKRSVNQCVFVSRRIPM